MVRSYNRVTVRSFITCQNYHFCKYVGWSCFCSSVRFCSFANKLLVGLMSDLMDKLITQTLYWIPKAWLTLFSFGWIRAVCILRFAEWLLSICTLGVVEAELKMSLIVGSRFLQIHLTVHSICLLIVTSWVPVQLIDGGLSCRSLTHVYLLFFSFVLHIHGINRWSWPFYQWI